MLSSFFSLFAIIFFFFVYSSQLEVVVILLFDTFGDGCNILSVKSQDHDDNPFHYGVVLSNHKTLSRLLFSFPCLSNLALVHFVCDSFAQEVVADRISLAIDRRNIPSYETPFHLAICLSDTFAFAKLSLDKKD